MKTAQELRDEAQKIRQEAHESWERCGTDGFVTQHASGLNARLLEKQAEIQENGGVWSFPVLCQGDQQLDAKVCRGEYGSYWLLSYDDAARFGRRTIPMDDSHREDGDEFKTRRSRIQEKFGLHQEYRDVPAEAKIVGSGTGLSGLASCYVAVVRKQ